MDTQPLMAVCFLSSRTWLKDTDLVKHFSAVILTTRNGRHRYVAVAVELENYFKGS